MLYLFLILAATCLFLGLKKKKPLLLTVPFAAMFVYVAVEVILVPGSVVDTVKFIFSLR